MVTKSDKNRIKFAYFSTNWAFEGGDCDALIATAERVQPTEYEPHMANQLFCPSCFTNLSRSPADAPFFKNGRRACFKHWPSFKNVACDLRTPLSDGKNYLNEEEIKQAIENHELVIVSSFLTEKPTTQDLHVGAYDQSPIEDIAGPIENVAIGRHTGETFRLPTRLTTVRGLCRNFPDNLYRYYLFPGFSSPMRLIDALIDVADVTDVDETPRLYFGKIKRFIIPATQITPLSKRMTYLQHAPSVKDFVFKNSIKTQSEKGIDDNSIGRTILLWGKIEQSGLGLAFERLQWGEFALLPEKYAPFLA